MFFPETPRDPIYATTGCNGDGRWYLIVMDRTVDRDDWPRHYWGPSPLAPCARVRDEALAALGYTAIGRWNYSETEHRTHKGAADWGLTVEVAGRVAVPAEPEAPVVPMDVADLVDANQLVPEGAAA